MIQISDQAIFKTNIFVSCPCWKIFAFHLVRKVQIQIWSPGLLSYLKWWTSPRIHLVMQFNFLKRSAWRSQQVTISSKKPRNLAFILLSKAGKHLHVIPLFHLFPPQSKLHIWKPESWMSTLWHSDHRISLYYSIWSTFLFSIFHMGNFMPKTNSQYFWCNVS